jgi:hypothetical protein
MFDSVTFLMGNPGSPTIGQPIMPAFFAMMLLMMTFSIFPVGLLSAPG